jgi:hypothetical protein
LTTVRSLLDNGTDRRVDCVVLFGVLDSRSGDDAEETGHVPVVGLKPCLDARGCAAVGVGARVTLDLALVAGSELPESPRASYHAIAVGRFAPEELVTTHSFFSLSVGLSAGLCFSPRMLGDTFGGNGRGPVASQSFRPSSCSDFVLSTMHSEPCKGQATP